MTSDWLPWINFILIIILIIIIIILSFFGGGLIKGVNYSVQMLSASDTSVELKTGTNVMGIGDPKVDQTVVVLSNSNNREGLTFRITNSSKNNKKMTVAEGTNVNIDFGTIGDKINPGESAAFIEINNTNTFLRYE